RGGLQRDALRSDAAGRGTELPRLRGTPAGSAGPLARRAVLQHRPAAAARSGALLAQPDRRGIPPGVDAAVLRAPAARRTGAGLMPERDRQPTGQGGLWDVTEPPPPARLAVADPGRAHRSAAAARPLRLATWNVNSLRARLDRVTSWLARTDVDVLAIQETKLTDDKFPT